jgi:hAT family C-terminal dimerisation region
MLAIRLGRRGILESLSWSWCTYTINSSPYEQEISCNPSQEESRAFGKRKLEKRFAEFKIQNRFSRPKRSELDSYLEDDVLELEEDENFNILQWWKKNSELYPTLAKMARDFLAVPVSTVASESAFSAAGRLTDHLRNSMGAETLESLICTKDWFGPDDGSFDLTQFRPFMRNFGAI